MDEEILVSETELLLNGHDLTEVQIAECVDHLTSEKISPLQKKSFLTALAKKGESPKEFSRFVHEFRKRAINPGLEDFADSAIDLCGTGGDQAGSFNISTFVSFMVASAGVPVIKHGNRSISSSCGSADLLEAIGIPLHASPEKIRSGLEELNFAFLFAPNYHPAFKNIAPVRKLLAQEGIVTIFNLLGPTLNPAKPAHQLLGVFDQQYLTPIGNALQDNGTAHSMIVHGIIANEPIRGVDELTACGENAVYGYGRIKTNGTEIWSPSRWNQDTFDFHDLKGGNLEENLRIMNSVLRVDCSPGLLATILINAASAFTLCGKVESLEEGIALSHSLLKNGQVWKWLEKVKNVFA
jgi:anthranilate phosphoribosyltransferase